MVLSLQPVSYAEACAFIDEHHRHHRPPQGHKFSIALNDGEKIVAVAVVGRPVSRHLDNGYTAEVTRLCALEGIPNACSMLYSACWRAAKAMGYKRVITYILETEAGTSLRASNWQLVGEAGGGSWNCKSRPRIQAAPTCGKLLFEAA